MDCWRSADISRWLSGNALVSINVVSTHWVRLVPGWVTQVITALPGYSSTGKSWEVNKPRATTRSHSESWCPADSWLRCSVAREKTTFLVNTVQSILVRKSTKINDTLQESRTNMSECIKSPAYGKVKWVIGYRRDIILNGYNDQSVGIDDSSLQVAQVSWLGLNVIDQLVLFFYHTVHVNSCNPLFYDEALCRAPGL